MRTHRELWQVLLDLVFPAFQEIRHGRLQYPGKHFDLLRRRRDARYLTLESRI